LEWVEHGGFVITTPSPSAPNEPVEFTVHSLHHYNPTITLELGAGDITCPAEITVRRLPEELTGTLIVRFEPETGISLKNGTLLAGRRWCHRGTEHVINDPTEFRLPGVGEGPCAVMVIGEQRFKSTDILIDVLAGQVSEVTLPVFAVRQITMDFKVRPDSSAPRWKKGEMRVLTSGSWYGNREWGFDVSTVFRLSDWTERGVMIEPYNTEIILLSDEDFRNGKFPPNSLWGSQRRREYPVEVGSCFALRGKHGKKWQALIKVADIEPVVDIINNRD
jgi:hypothetical protein